MSGFEIAGIVLGVFPLVLDNAKELRGYLEKSSMWWNFQRDYTGFVSVLEGESVAYLQNLDFLLSPLDLEDGQLRSLQEEPRSALWHDPYIRAKLRSRIKDSYLNWFMRQLQEINEALGGLYRLLPTRDGKICYPRPGTIDHEILRLKASFSSVKQPLLDQVTRINDTLYKFLVKDSQIARISRPNRSKPFLKLQSHSLSLSKAFQNQWNCSCSRSHPCGITTEWRNPRVDRSGPKLKLLIGQGHEQKQLKVEFQPVGLSGSLQQPSTSLDQIEDLTKQMRLSEQSRVLAKAAENHRVGIAAIAAASTGTNAIGTKTEKFWLKRQTNKLRKIAATKAARVFNTPSTNQPTGEGGDAAACIPTQAENATTRPTREVRFATSASSPADSSTPVVGASTPINNLCRFLRYPCAGTSIEHMVADGKLLSFSIDPPGQTGNLFSVPEDLRSFAKNTRRLPDRLRIGLNLATNIIGLGNSTWLPQTWDSKTVFVLKDTLSQSPPVGPYFPHHCVTDVISTNSTNHSIKIAERALFALGVILLELTYQQVLEEQPYWHNYCVNGVPNGWTPRCTAMAWEEQVESQYSDYLADPIRRCVTGAFYSTANLADPNFVQEVYEGVIVPLEEFLSAWRSER